MGDYVLWGVFLVLILCYQSHASCETLVKGLCLEETTRNWTEASDSCTLAVFNTPLSVGVSISGVPIIGHHRPRVQRSGSRDIHWIGATGEFTPWLKLLGCFPYFYPPTFSRKLTFSSNIGPVAECHQICEDWNKNYKELGINESHCFCKENEKTGFGSLQTIYCKLQNSKNVSKDLIGSSKLEESFIGIAMYKKINHVTKIEDGLDECLIETGDGNKTYPCDSADSMKRTWAESLKRRETENNELPRWTPYIRRLIISENRGNSAFQDGTVCIGVRYQSKAYEPIPLPCSETHTYLCQNDTKTDTTTPHITSFERRTSIMENTTFVHHKISTTPFNHQNDHDGTTTPCTTRSSYGTSWEQTTFGHQVTDSSPVDRQNDSNDTPASTLPLIIGSAVGTLLCIVIVVIIIVIFIKRRRPNKKENSHPAPTENVYYSEMKEDEKSQLTMKKAEPSPTFDSTDYDTMMSANKEKITDDSEEYGKLLPNSETDVYNHTWDKPITEQFTDHVYSSTISGNDVNVYDHTVTSNTELTKESEEKRSILNRNYDNLYDHTDTNETELTKVSGENRALSTGNGLNLYDHKLNI